MKGGPDTAVLPRPTAVHPLKRAVQSTDSLMSCLKLRTHMTPQEFTLLMPQAFTSHPLLRYSILLVSLE